MGHDGNAIRVMIVDDQQIFRRGLRKLLAEGGIDVVGEAANGKDALAQAVQLAPDVIVIDPDLPGINGVEVIRELAGTVPLARSVVLTATADGDRVARAIHAGAHGYVLRNALPDAILNCVHAAAAGDFLVSAGVAANLLSWLRDSQPRLAVSDEHVELSPRELEVLRLVAQGKDNCEIAEALFLSPGTVKKHVSRIFEKLRAENRVQAAVFAVLKGLL